MFTKLKKKAERNGKEIWSGMSEFTPKKRTVTKVFCFHATVRSNYTQAEM